MYFSWSGNTESVANEIQTQTGVDIFEIIPAEPYTDDYNTLLDIAQDEQANNARPAIAEIVQNFEQYDVVYLGYPNWWGDMPMILRSLWPNGLPKSVFPSKGVVIWSGYWHFYCHYWW